jgi:DNA-binding NtrC family response regulator
VLQERTFERVGDARAVPLDARVIAATHRDLAQMVKQGTFREDLYYRLRVVEIHLPPLRERATDIPVLVEGLLAKITRDLGKEVRYVTPAALAKLSGHAWPGNVRELRNVLERAVILCEGGYITSEHLPLDIASGPAVAAATTAPSQRLDGMTVDAAERELIVQALARSGNNKSKAARILGLTRAQLRSRIEKHGLVTEG